MSDFKIDPIDNDDDRSSGKGMRIGLIFLFTIICAGIAAGAVWLFFFSGYLLSPKQETTGRRMYYVEVKLSQISLNLDEGDRCDITASLIKTAESRDIDTHRLKLVWRSENPEVASVNQRGEIKAVSQGSARISVYIDNDSVNSNTAYCQVNIWPGMPERPTRTPADSTRVDSTALIAPVAVSHADDAKANATSGSNSPKEADKSKNKTEASAKPTKAEPDEKIRDKVSGAFSKHGK